MGKSAIWYEVHGFECPLTTKKENKKKKGNYVESILSQSSLFYLFLLQWLESGKILLEWFIVWFKKEKKEK